MDYNHLEDRIRFAVEHAVDPATDPFRDKSGYSEYRDYDDSEPFAVNVDRIKPDHVVEVEDFVSLATLFALQSAVTYQTFPDDEIERTVRHEEYHARLSRQLGSNELVYGVGFYEMPSSSDPAVTRVRPLGAYIVNVDFTATKIQHAAILAAPALSDPSQTTFRLQSDLETIQLLGYEDFDDVARRAEAADIHIV